MSPHAEGTEVTGDKEGHAHTHLYKSTLLSAHDSRQGSRVKCIRAGVCVGKCVFVCKGQKCFSMCPALLMKSSEQ